MLAMLLLLADCVCGNGSVHTWPYAGARAAIGSVIIAQDHITFTAEHVCRVVGSVQPTENLSASKSSLSASRSTASCSSPNVFTQLAAPHDAVRT